MHLITPLSSSRLISFRAKLFGNMVIMTKCKVGEFRDRRESLKKFIIGYLGDVHGNIH